MKSHFYIIRNFLGLVLLLFLLWILCALYYFFQDKKNEITPTYIAPNEAKITMYFNNKILVNDFAHSVFIEGKGNDFINQLKNKKWKNETKNEYGINWLEDVTYFQQDVKGSTVQGIIVHVIDSKKWNQNSATFFGKGTIAKRIGNSGIIVQSDELSKEELNKVIASCRNTEKKVVNHGQNHFLISNFKFEEIELQLNHLFESNRLITNGYLEYHTNKSQIPNKLNSNFIVYRLQPNFLHFTSDVENILSSNFLQEHFGLAIKGVSFNYKGLLVKNIDNKKIFLPDADFVFAFENNVSTQDFVDQLSFFSQKELNNDVLKIAGEKYFIKSLNENHIYIGKTQNPELLKNNSEFGLELSGELKYLFEIKGDRLVKSLLKMNPIASSGIKLSNLIQNCYLVIQKQSENEYTINGKIDFPYEDLAILELLKVALDR